MNPVPTIPHSLITAASVVLGALIGSFLNVCIYRLPLGLSVWSPARSYCPHCRKTIPWWENFPIVSWITLRGRCSTCKNPIHVRYLLVELLAAVLFGAGAAFLPLDPPLLLLPTFTLLGMFIVATAVDLEHMIIPDEITLGGVGAGVVFSILQPALHGSSTRLHAFGLSVLGAATGYFILWAVAELGRLALGRKRIRFQYTTPALWIRNKDEAQLIVCDEVTPWSELFVRGTENIRMGVDRGDIDGAAVSTSVALWTLNQIQIFEPPHAPKKPVDLDLVNRISLQIHWMVIPREVMGFGDVKFLAAIGAFLGWKATLFTLAAASCLAAFYALVTLLIGRCQWAAIPFGPFLAAGGLIWIINGPRILESYLQIFFLER
jgi:leader peptidase (prepilin peptidase)/N-methyltransferase